MGSVIAGNILRAGYTPAVYNRTRQKTAELAAAGCAVVEEPAGLAARSDIVLVMVSDEKAMESVLNGPFGLFRGGFSGKTLITLSTLPVSYVRELAAQCAGAGVRFLDCPVSGSMPMAEKRQLVFLAAGEDAVLNDCEAVLLAAGGCMVRAGKPPDGTALKLCVNLILAQMTAALAESVALAGVLKIAPSSIFEVMDRSTAFNCGFFRLKRESVLSSGPASPRLFRNMRKDVKYMLDEAEKGGQRLPVLEALHKVMGSADQGSLGA